MKTRKGEEAMSSMESMLKVWARLEGSGEGLGIGQTLAQTGLNTLEYVFTRQDYAGWWLLYLTYGRLAHRRESTAPSFFFFFERVTGMRRGQAGFTNSLVLFVFGLNLKIRLVCIRVMKMPFLTLCFCVIYLFGRLARLDLGYDV